MCHWEKTLSDGNTLAVVNTINLFHELYNSTAGIHSMKETATTTKNIKNCLEKQVHHATLSSVKRRLGRGEKNPSALAHGYNSYRLHKLFCHIQKVLGLLFFFKEKKYQTTNGMRIDRFNCNISYGYVKDIGWTSFFEESRCILKK